LLVDPKVLLFWFGNFKKFVRISYILKLNKLFFNFQINYFPPKSSSSPWELGFVSNGRATTMAWWFINDTEKLVCPRPVPATGNLPLTTE
jgi:hypothetical protein